MAKSKRSTLGLLLWILFPILFANCELGGLVEWPNWTIVYNANGGSGIMENSAHVYGTAKKLNANTFTRVGYRYLGWAETPNGGVTYTDGQSVDMPSKAIGGIINLYAVWNANTYTIAYNANGGSGTMENSVHVYGTAKPLNVNIFINLPYTFAGWALTENGTIEYTDTQSVLNLTETNGETVTLYAKWVTIAQYTVSFSSNGGSNINSQTIDSGGMASRPADPTRSGYTFDNWYSNPGLTTVYDFSTPVMGHITLYAKWNQVVPGSFTVVFESNGGSGVPTQVVNSGGTANRPENPARSGYTFDNWYGDPGLNTVYNFSTSVTGNIMLYAKWNVIKFTVTFDSKSGSNIDSQTIDSGGMASRPADPARNGYIFDNWYGDPGLNTIYNFSTPVTGSITLYAKWTLISPENVTAKAISEAVIQISWDQTVGATGYKVYDSGGVVLTAIGGDGNTQYEHSSLNAGTVYSYRISALAGDEESVKSSLVSARTWERLVFNKEYSGTVSIGLAHYYRFYVTNGASYAFTSNVSASVKYETGDMDWFNVSSGTESQTAGSSGWAYINIENAGAYTLKVCNPEAAISAFLIDSSAGTVSEANKTITVSVPFGTSLISITPSVTPASGWTCTTTGARNFTNPVEYVFTKGDVTQIYTVTVTPNGEGGITINPPPITDITIGGFPALSFTISRSGTGGYLTSRSITLTGSGYSSIEWWIGETDKTASAANGGMTFAVQAASCTLGEHTLTVIVYKDGIPYSNEVDFTVIQ
jgi:uncharacterized repeat protein (TIGR02543 family)